MEFADADQRGGLLHQGAGDGSWQDRQPRSGQEGRLHPLLQAEHADRRHRGEGQYASLNAFLNAWQIATRKQAILDELASRGVFLDELAEQVGRDVDAFDLICHIAFDAPPLTRRERAAKVRKRNVFGRYGDKTRAVLEALLDKYADAGLKSVESLEILKVDPLTRFGTPVEIVGLFGGKQGYLAAIAELEAQLYAQAA